MKKAKRTTRLPDCGDEKRGTNDGRGWLISVITAYMGTIAYWASMVMDGRQP